MKLKRSGERLTNEYHFLEGGLFVKRLAKAGIITMSCVLTFGAGAYAASAVPKLFINSNQVTFDAQPKLIDGRMYVPIRAVSEGLGVPIHWDSNTKTVYVNSDPNAKVEPVTTLWVSKRNLVTKFIISYDERNYEDAMETVSKNFTTDIYAEFPSAGGVESSSIIDYKIVATDGNEVNTKITVQVVRRLHPSQDTRNIKIENWQFEVGDRINAVKIVPNTVKYLDRYTVTPGATFGLGYR